MNPSGPGLSDVSPAGEYANLYPSTGADTGFQATRKRVYHSSDTRRFLGFSRATANRCDTVETNVPMEEGKGRKPDLKETGHWLKQVCPSLTCASVSAEFSPGTLRVEGLHPDAVGRVGAQVLQLGVVSVSRN